MDNNSIIVVILVISIILIVLCLICNKKERFDDKKELRSPVILRVNKKKSDAILEWYNEDNRVKEFIVLYLDVFSDIGGVWVQRSIRCDKKKCRLLLRNLLGTRYKLTILSVLGNKISDIEDIVDFSDKRDYENLYVIEGPAASAPGTDDINIDFNKLENNKKPLESPVPSDSLNSNNSKDNKNNKNNKKTPSPSPSESKIPKIVCNPKVVRENIKTKEQLEEAEVDYKCNDDRDIGLLSAFIEKKPFYYNTWEKIFE